MKSTPLKNWSWNLDNNALLQFWLHGLLCWLAGWLIGWFIIMHVLCEVPNRYLKQRNAAWHLFLASESTTKRNIAITSTITRLLSTPLVTIETVTLLTRTVPGYHRQLTCKDQEPSYLNLLLLKVLYSRLGLWLKHRAASIQQSYCFILDRNLFSMHEKKNNNNNT